MASAARPMAKSGARNDIAYRTVMHALAAQEVLEQHLVDRLGRVDHQVVDASLAEQLARPPRCGRGSVPCSACAGARGRPESARRSRGPRTFPRRRSEVQLRRIEQVHNDEVVPGVPQRAQRVADLVRRLVQVGQDQHDALPMLALRHLEQRHGQRPAPARLGAIERVQHLVQVLGRAAARSRRRPSRRTRTRRDRAGGARSTRGKRRGTSRTPASTGRCVPYPIDADTSRIARKLALVSASNSFR